MREAELLRPLLLEEIDIASEPEDEKILELIDRLITLAFEKADVEY